MNSRLALSSRVLLASLATMLLTSIHHAYGAIVYSTPWRMHVVGVCLIAAPLIGGALALHKRARRGSAVEYAAFWVFVGLNLLFPVLAIGAFEGLYNHGLKNLLYYGGASPGLFNAMFPPPAYEPPTNLFFEFTGVLQIVPASMAAIYLARDIMRRRAR
jgi:uncharacterized membrane protein